MIRNSLYVLTRICCRIKPYMASRSLNKARALGRRSILWVQRRWPYGRTWHRFRTTGKRRASHRHC